ncbi:MAG: hypothetical protein AAGD06_23660 [Acidobacteriota bacterium]
MLRSKLPVFLALACAVAFSTALWAVTAMEFDDFEDGTTQNWAQGASTGQPTNEPDGGPNGTGDNYLQTVSTGTAGPGSRMAVFNQNQWIGDYASLGSEVVITMQLANFGATAMSIRIGIEATIPMSPEGGGDRWVTTNAFALPADGVWRSASFTLSTAEMTQVEGSGTLLQALDNVTQFRVVSAASPAWQGDAIAATLGMDNVEITQVPVELMTFSVD